MAKKRRTKRPYDKSKHLQHRKTLIRFIENKGYEMSGNEPDEILLSFMDNFGYLVHYTSDTRKQIEKIAKWIWNGRP